MRAQATALDETQVDAAAAFVSSVAVRVDTITPTVRGIQMSSAAALLTNPADARDVVA
jgi:hypothetical protein